MTALATGAVIGGDFEVLRPLGAGGMGSVYVVRQKSTGHERALKVMHPQMTANESLRAKFIREAQISSKIESEHVVQVLAAGVDAATGLPWLVMELLRGQGLAELVAEHGPPAEDLAREIFRQLSHGLAAAHRVGVVHRDLKPDNIFLSRSMRSGEGLTVKILDFGIAKVAAEAKTHASVAIGSPAWMAPEQAEVGREISPATDVWALGLIAFFVLTGKMFWRTATQAEATPVMVIKEAMIDRIPSASERARALGCEKLLPPRFDEWFGQCVARDVVTRFATAEIALAAFETLFPTRESATRVSLPASSERSASLGSTTSAVSLGLGETVRVSAPPSSHAVVVNAPHRRSVLWYLVPGIAAVAVAGFFISNHFRRGPSRPTQSVRGKPHLIASSSAQPALAELDAMRLYGDKSDRKNLPMAIALFKKGCNDTKEDSCAGLGIAMLRGEGVPKDTSGAITLLQTACDGGSLLGCSGLGTAFLEGSGVPKDPKRGIGLYERACDGGEMVGCTSLATAYTFGTGVAKDDARAAALYDKACGAGIVLACTNLGFAYDNGAGLPRDERHADELYEKACTGGSLLACTYLAFAYQNGTGVTKDDRRAGELFERACVHGYQPACSHSSANAPSLPASAPSGSSSASAPSASAPAPMP